MRPTPAALRAKLIALGKPVLLWLVTLLCPACCWATWPMFRHDPQHSGRSAYAGPDHPWLKWETWLPTRPASLVLGTNGVLYVQEGFYPGTGGIRIIGPEGGSGRRVSLQFDGMMRTASPCIDNDGNIYVHFYEPTTAIVAKEYLWSCDSNGNFRWSFTLNNGTAVPVLDPMSSPTIGSNNTVYVCSAGGGLYAISTSGTQQWATNMSQFPIGTSPAIGLDGTVYAVDMFSLFAFSPSGQNLWKTKIDGTTASPNASPVCGANGDIYVGKNLLLYAFSPTGSTNWMMMPADADIVEYTPAIGTNGWLYLLDNGLRAINPNGALMWTRPSNVPGHAAAPTIDSNGVIYWTELNGNGQVVCFAYNADGGLKWLLPLNPTASVDWPPSFPPSIVIGPDHTLYMLWESQTGTWKLQAYDNNEAPIVRITQPLQNQHFSDSLDTVIPLAAEASDPDGLAPQVTFYIQETDSLIGPLNPPYTAATIPYGQNILTVTATATDSRGATTVSTPVQVLVSPANDMFNDATIASGPYVDVTGHNTGATSEPGEPNHGFPFSGNGKSVWWAWTAPATGTATMDTAGSSFDTEIAVYTGTKLTNLLAVARADVPFATESVQFEVTNGVLYYIAIDGSLLPTDMGNIRLRIQLLGFPRILSGPVSQTGIVGGNALLSVDVSGDAPLGYAWRYNGTPMATGNQNPYILSNITRSNQGNYSVTVTNNIGAVTSSEAFLRVFAPQRLMTPAVNGSGGMVVSFSDATGIGLPDPSKIQVQAATTIGSNVLWKTLTNAVSVNSNGFMFFMDSEATNSSRFYRTVEHY